MLVLDVCISSHTYDYQYPNFIEPRSKNDIKAPKTADKDLKFQQEARNRSVLVG